MQFGTFVLRVNPDPELDGERIHSALQEAELAEALGFDAVWLTEHHFSGDAVYADPVVFAAAIAARTRRIRIGFAVVQLPLHHPVRLAAQTALLDNLSHGRLIVGTGRGSALNEYEYLGFGTTMAAARQCLQEAEELLLAAWTQQDVDFQGTYWRARFPTLRPRPYTQPHPPLVRACLSEESVRAMARLGRPIMLGFERTEVLEQRLRQYGAEMLAAGFGEAQVAAALDACWVQKSLYVAESDQQALEEALPGFGADVAHFTAGRTRFNLQPGPSEDRYGLGMLEHNLIAGSPGCVAEKVAELREIGARNLLLGMSPSGLTRDQVAHSMRLFAEQVAPRFRAA